MTLVGLAARNVWRNKFRTILTIAGVVVAVLAFMLLRTLLFAWTSAVEFSAKDRLVTRHKITFVMELPKAYINAVRGAEHVKMATYANWFGGKDPKHDDAFFATLAVDHETYFKVYDDQAVPPEQMDAWQKDKQGAIIGDLLAKKMGWKVGDKVFLQSGIYGMRPSWDFTIDGIYEAKSKAVARDGFFFHWDYLNDALPEAYKATNGEHVGWIVSRIDDGKKSAEISKFLDDKFDTLDPQTVSQDEYAFRTSFLAGFSAIFTAVDVISVVILVIMMLVLGNTIAMGVRERTNEYGVMKALGFSGGQIAGFIVMESTFIAMIGGAIGVGLAFPFIEKGMGAYLQENMGGYFPSVKIDPVMAGIAAGIAIALGIFAAAIPAYRASKLNVILALRRVA